MKERDFVREVLRGFRPRKRLGQHFLVNELVADRIVAAADISSEDICLEIGAGLGVLTRRMVPQAQLTVAVEIDEKLCEILERRDFRRILGRSNKLALLKCDILQLRLTDLRDRYGVNRFKVISNLPYRVTTPIIFWLIENRRYITNAILTLQQEVAERLAAEPGSKEYGSITLKVHYYATISVLHEISRKNFLPVPEVDSTLVRMDFLSGPRLRVKDEERLFDLIDRSFQHRRKMLRSCLKSDFGLTSEGLRELERTSDIDLRRRGETLSLREFASVSEKMEKVCSR